MFPFCGTSKLEVLEIRGSVKQIASDAFNSRNTSGSDQYCHGFHMTAASAKLIIREGVMSIGSYAFENCDVFRQVYLPDSLTSISEYAFKDCSRIDLMRIGKNTTSIASTAFSSAVVSLFIVADGNTTAYNQLKNQNRNVLYESELAFSENLTYHANGGVFSSGDTALCLSCKAFEALPEAEIPTNGGKIFSGWFIDPECAVRFTDRYMPFEDLTLYAGWDIDVYTLTLDPMGGTLAESGVLRVSAGSSPTDGIVPTRDQYAFEGWYTDTDCTDLFSGTMPYGDLTLYAGWRRASPNAEYSFENGQAKLVRYTVVQYESPDICLPESVNGCPLTAVAADAFRGQRVFSLRLPATLETLEDGALNGMDKLREISVSGENPYFRTVDGLLCSKDGTVLYFVPACRTDLTVPNAARKIAPFACADGQLRNIDFGKNLSEIGAYAFAGTKLTAVELPASLQTIGRGAFYDCNSLGLVIADGDITDIDPDAFRGCAPFASFYGPAYECALEAYAHANNYYYNLYSLTLINGTSERTAVYEAGAALMLPTDQDVGENARFTGWFTDSACETPWTGDVMPQDSLTLYAGRTSIFAYESLSEDNAGLCLTSYLLSDPTAVIPSSVSGAPVRAVAGGCFPEGMRSITVPDCVTSLEDGAIPYTDGLVLICGIGSAAETYALANGIDIVRREYTLRFDTDGGSGIGDLTVREGEKIRLPVPVRSGCEFTGWFTDDAAPAETDGEGYYTVTGNALFLAGWTVTDEETARVDFTYEETDGHIIVTGLRPDVTALVIPETLNGLPVTEIARNAFSGNTELVSVRIPGSIGTVADNAFENCRRLETVLLSEGIQSIGRSAFEGCETLASLSLPSSLKRADDRAFSGTALTGLILGTDFEWLAPGALDDCLCLTAIHVAEGNAWYRDDDGVLYDLTEDSLVRYPQAKAGSSYTVASGTYSIGAGAFEGAGNLSAIYLPETVWSVGAGAFKNCVKLSSLPEMASIYLTVISDYCFMNCRSLTEILIPENIVSIGTGAFSGCTGLQSAEIGAGVTEIGAGAFTPGGLRIRGAQGTAAEEYARRYSILFERIGTTVFPESVSLDQESLFLKRGETARLTVSLTPANVTEPDIIWYSSDESVATVSDSGLVRAISDGDAEIFARTVNGITAFCPVSVDPLVYPTNIIIKNIAKTCFEQEEIIPSVTFEPASCEIRSLTWTSDRPDIITVDENGGIRTLAAGSAILTAETANGLTESFAVRVVHNEVTDPAREATCCEDGLTEGRHCAVCGEILLAQTTIPAAGHSLFFDAPTYETSVSAPVTICLTQTCACDDLNLADWTVSFGALERDADNLRTAVFTSDRCGVATAVIDLSDGCTKPVTCEIIVHSNHPLTLPASLSVIEEEAFRHTPAEEILLPESVRLIGAYAFADCDHLAVMALPAALTNIADTAFDGCDHLTLLCENEQQVSFAIENGIRYIRR